MTKFVFLGSCRFEPYDILIVPKKLTNTPHTTEEGYLLATKLFFPAILESDVIIIYAPDGIGEHTQRDINFALRNNKNVFELVRYKKIKSCPCTYCEFYTYYGCVANEKMCQKLNAWKRRYKK